MAHKGQTANENNGNWHDSSDRGVILEWVKRRIGKPSQKGICSDCETTQSMRFVWYSKSGEYKRDVTDYICLCNSCFTIRRKQVPWNKGKKGLQVGWNKGLKLPQNEGEGNPNWKGNKPLEYKHAHAAVIKIYGQPRLCELCKRTDRKQYEWANTTGIFARDRSNWLRLCKSCHLAFDNVMEKRRQNKLLKQFP